MNNHTIGHNIMVNPQLELNAALAGLALAVNDIRTTSRHRQEQMVIVARHLVLVDHLAADDEAFADSQIKIAGVVQPTDVIANAQERTYARWLARGGVMAAGYSNFLPKKLNEIKDLSASTLNSIEARFLTGRKFAKLTTYSSIYQVIIRECKAEIRDALDGKEGKPNLDEVRAAYAENLFREETISEWIEEENYRRSDLAARIAELKKAWVLRIEEAVEEAKDNPEALDRLGDQVKKQLAQVRALAAQRRAEAEARKAAASLTAGQRKLIEESHRRAASQDDDDDLGLTS